MWFKFEALSSLTPMQLIMVHTWNIFFGVRKATLHFYTHSLYDTIDLFILEMHLFFVWD